MMKPTDSQQVESERTNRIPQQGESDATLPSPNSLVSFEITPEVTHGDDYVADEDANDDQGHVMGKVQNSITVGRARRNLCKPNWLTTNMIEAYALLVFEEAVTSTYRKAKISLESKM